MAHEQNRDLYEALDDIATFLVEGEAWHLAAANSCRKISIRGIGRWHDCESRGDKRLLDHLVKMLGDRLQYNAKISYQYVGKAQEISLKDLDDFRKHFHVWIDREKEFIEVLNFAVSKAGAVDMELYQCLCGIVKEVQDEVMRARMVYDSFEFTSWQPHDISVKSKWIHEYMEHDYPRTGDLNFNIG